MYGFPKMTGENMNINDASAGPSTAKRKTMRGHAVHRAVHAVTCRVFNDQGTRRCVEHASHQPLSKRCRALTPSHPSEFASTPGQNRRPLKAPLRLRGGGVAACGSCAGRRPRACRSRSVRLITGCQMQWPRVPVTQRGFKDWMLTVVVGRAGHAGRACRSRRVP